MNNKEKIVFENLIYLIQMLIEKDENIGIFIAQRNEYAEALTLQKKMNKVVCKR